MTLTILDPRTGTLVTLSVAAARPSVARSEDVMAHRSQRARRVRPAKDLK